MLQPIVIHMMEHLWTTGGGGAPSHSEPAGAKPEERASNVVPVRGRWFWVLQGFAAARVGDEGGADGGEEQSGVDSAGSVLDGHGNAAAEVRVQYGKRGRQISWPDGMLRARGDVGNPGDVGGRDW